jgi:hypothetical protein
MEAQNSRESPVSVPSAPLWPSAANAGRETGTTIRSVEWMVTRHERNFREAFWRTETPLFVDRIVRLLTSQTRLLRATNRLIGLCVSIYEPFGIRIPVGRRLNRAVGLE